MAESLSATAGKEFLKLDEKEQGVKIMPYSIEAEQSLLGGLILDSGAWETVVEKLGEDDFYHPAHRLLYNTISKIVTAGEPLDHVTLAESLDQQGDLDQAGGLAYLVELSKNTPSIANVSAYADLIREHSVLRQIIQAANQIASNAYSPEGLNSTAILEKAERAVFDITDNRVSTSGPVDVKSVLNSTLDRIDHLFNCGGDIIGLTTGFDDLNTLTSGLQNGDLIIVAGRPSMGKTTLAMNLVENALTKSVNKTALVFSLEMPADHLMMRMLASLGRINQTHIRTGKLEEEDWPKLTMAMKLIQEQKLFIDDTAGISPPEMRAKARRIAREHGKIDIIMIDYLQLMQIQGFSEGRTNEISEISRSLKAMAKEFNCPVVALSQLNRSLEQRPNKRPVNSDLRESGAIEQDADVIMFIYRDEVYNPETEYKGVGEIIIGKQRNGPIGTVRVAFRGSFCRFENLAPDAYANFSDE